MMSGEDVPTDEELISRYVCCVDESPYLTTPSASSCKSTLNEYRDHLGECDILRADLPLMDSFVTGVDDEGLPHRSAAVRDRVTILREFYIWCQMQGWTRDDPALHLYIPRVPQRNPRPILDEDWLKIWSQDLSPRARTILGLAYFCGLRRTELWDLRVSQLHDGAVHDFMRENGHRLVHRWDRVLELYERTDTLKPLLLDSGLLTDSIRQLRESGLDWLCEGRDSDGHINQLDLWWANHMPDGVVTQPYMARHSCATNLGKTSLPERTLLEYLDDKTLVEFMEQADCVYEMFQSWLEKTSRSKSPQQEIPPKTTPMTYLIEVTSEERESLSVALEFCRERWDKANGSNPRSQYRSNLETLAIRALQD